MMIMTATLVQKKTLALMIFGHQAVESFCQRNKQMTTLAETAEAHLNFLRL